MILFKKSRTDKTLQFIMTDGSEVIIKIKPSCTILNYINLFCAFNFVTIFMLEIAKSIYIVPKGLHLQPLHPKRNKQ